MKNKKLLGLLGVTTLLVGGMFVNQKAEPVSVQADTAKIIHLKPGKNWKQSSAWFAARCWTDSPFVEKWYKLEDGDKDGIYSASIDTSTYKKVIFTRMDSSKTDLGWGSKWNQTGDLTFPTDSKNLFTVSDSSWDGATTTWSTKTVTYHLPGSWDGDNWKQDENQLTLSGTDYVITKELDVGTYEFKVSVDKAWDISYGFDDFSSKSNNLVKATNDNNVKLTSTGGFYKFVYSPKNHSLNVTHTPYTSAELFDKYYNEGSYIKETTLNTNEFVESEVKNYFHAGAQNKYRQTVYSTNGLTMKSSKTVVTDWDTIEGTSTYQNIVNSEGKITGISHLKNGVQDYVVPNNVAGEDRSSVENWFVTLHDFNTYGLDNWSYENGVYTYNLEGDIEMKRMAREFVAPMWLNTEKAANYVTFNKLTAQETADGLVLKLYVESVNDGHLVSGANLVFSQAVIKKA